MPTVFSLRSDLEHDGDGVVHYRIEAVSRDFRAATWVWGRDEDAAELAKLLRGFPSRIGARVHFAVGAPGTGRCELDFSTVDGSGRCLLTAAVHSSSQVEPAQSAVVCVEFLPAELDRFCAELQRFKRNRDNYAQLGSDAA